MKKLFGIVTLGLIVTMTLAVVGSSMGRPDQSEKVLEVKKGENSKLRRMNQSFFPQKIGSAQAMTKNT